MPVIGLTVHVWSVVYASSSLVVPTSNIQESANSCKAAAKFAPEMV